MNDIKQQLKETLGNINKSSSNKNHIVLKLKTLTPLYTGGIGQQGDQIHPSNLLGGIRHFSCLVARFLGEKDFEKKVWGTAEESEPKAKQIALKWDTSELKPINFHNKQIKINNNSNTKVEDDDKTKEKSKKLSRYDKLVNLVDDYTNDPELKEALISYCKYRLEKNNNFYANMFKGLLNKLDSLEGDKVKIVNNALVNGWNSFYPINDYNNTKKSIKQSACERNVKSIVASEEDIKKEEEIRERRKKNGERICF